MSGGVGDNLEPRYRDPDRAERRDGAVPLRDNASARQIDTAVAAVEQQAVRPENRPFQVPVNLRRSTTGGTQPQRVDSGRSLPADHVSDSALPNSEAAGEGADAVSSEIDPLPPVVPLNLRQSPGGFRRLTQSQADGTDRPRDVPLSSEALMRGQRVDPRPLTTNPLVQNLLRRIATENAPLGPNLGVGTPSSELPLVGIPRPKEGENGGLASPRPLVAPLPGAMGMPGPVGATALRTPFVLNPQIPPGVQAAIRQFQASGAPVTTRVGNWDPVIATGVTAVRPRDDGGARPGVNLAVSNGPSLSRPAPVPNPQPLNAQTVLQPSQAQAVPVGQLGGNLPSRPVGGSANAPDLGDEDSTISQPGEQPVSAAVNLTSTYAIGQVKR